MLLFKTIRFKNFLSYGNYFTQISLNRTEMTLICGENGAGKTTFLDALCFCLFGKPYRNINIPQLPNSINGKDCLVECEFSIGSNDYLIRRGLNPKVFEIHKNGTLIDQDSTTKDYQRMLEEQILRMSFKTFCQVVILGSTNYIPFMRLPAADRRAIVESLLDIGVFSAMNLILKNRVSANREDIRNCETTISIIGSKMETQRKYIALLEEKSRSSLDELEGEISSTEESRKSLDAAVRKGSNILHKINERRDIKRKKDQSITDMRKLEASLVKKKTSVEKEIANLSSGGSVCPSCGKPLDKEHLEKEVSHRISKIEQIDSALSDIGTRISKEEAFVRDNNLLGVDAEFEKLSGVMTEHRNKLSVAEKMLDRLRADVEKIRKSRNSMQQEQDALDGLEGEMLAMENELSAKQKEQGILSNAQVVLKDTGIKTKVIRHYLPVMNKMINHYLSSMDFFVQFNLDENFEETIKSRHRDEFTYSSFSEGEKMRIDLSLLLAWREVARLKNSTNCNLLVLDEVFDSSLDGTGMDEFMKLLKGLGSRCNIFVISHKSDQLIDKFQEVLTFKKKNNFSRMMS
jgi:DNA repair exonuclease SbcCD ATPase subunit